MNEAEKILFKELKKAFIPWVKQEKEDFHKRRREAFKRKYGVDSGIVVVDTGDGVAQDLANKDTKVIKK